MRFLKSFYLFVFLLIVPFIASAGEDKLDFVLKQAEAEILSVYGDIVSVSEKGKSLTKFGRNDDISTAWETVWLRGGDETYATGNDIDTISSSDAGDTQVVVVEGHTISNGELTFVVQSVTLQGQTQTSLSTPLYRATRLYNNDSTDFAGAVYLYQSGGTVTAGVPQVVADIHLQTNGDNNQSLKAATSTSSQDYWIITAVDVGVNRQNTRGVNFVIQVREYGKVFRTRLPFATHSYAGPAPIPLIPPLIVPPNSDVRVRAISSGASTGVSATLFGYLAIKK